MYAIYVLNIKLTGDNDSIEPTAIKYTPLARSCVLYAPRGGTPGLYDIS